MLFLTEMRQQPIFVMNLIEITRLCNGPILKLIQWLQGRNLLASPLRCAACNQAMLRSVKGVGLSGPFKLC